MNATITLDPKEVTEAVRLYLHSKGYALTTPVRFDVEREYPDHGQGEQGRPVFAGASVGVKPAGPTESSATSFLRNQGY